MRRESATISKPLAKNILAVVPRGGIYDTEIDYSRCPQTCTHYQDRIKEVVNFTTVYHCGGKCSTPTKKEVLIEGVVYDSFRTSFRLSRLQIAQYLGFHYFDIDDYGFVKNIPYEEIAERIHCSVRTIQNNNKILAELGFIALERGSNSKHFSVYVVGYKFRNEKKDEGGGGYFNMPFEAFEKLLSKSQVNDTRGFLEVMIRTDSSLVKKGVPTCSLSVENTKSFFPGYAQNQNSLKSLAESIVDVFEVNFIDNRYNFKLKNEFNGKLVLETKKANYSQDYILTLTTADIKFTNKDVDDLFQMSIQYGVQTVQNTLHRLIEEKVFIEDTIDNFGAYVRTQIRMIS